MYYSQNLVVFSNRSNAFIYIYIYAFFSFLFFLTFGFSKINKIYLNFLNFLKQTKIDNNLYIIDEDAYCRREQHKLGEGDRRERHWFVQSFT